MPTRELDKLLLRNADRTEATTKAFEGELASRYREAYKEIEGQLASLYAKMGDNPSLIEARRYGRLDSVKRAIAAEYKKLTSFEIKGTRDNSASTYADAYYGSAWAYDQAIGVEIKWPILPVDAIRASVWSGATGENFSERLKQWNVKELLTLQSKITSGLAQGFGYPKVARTIKAEVNDDYSRIVRIVRTEATRNYTQGHLQLYDNLPEGIKARKQWVATLDTRTRDAHGALNGQFADENGNFHSPTGAIGPGPGLMGNPGDDINERCRMVEIIDDLSPEYRRIKGEGIVEYKTYDQWAEENGKTAKGWPVEVKAKLDEWQTRKY
jgi:SPP1 gp7 family putative phage head morphogenesis protein